MDDDSEETVRYYVQWLKRLMGPQWATLSMMVGTDATLRIMQGFRAQLDHLIAHWPPPDDEVPLRREHWQ